MRTQTILVLLTIVVIGCTSQQKADSSPPKATLLSLEIRGHTGHWEPKIIPDDAAELLHSIVTTAPDKVLHEPIPLEAIHIVEIKGIRYALTPNKIILRNTRIWESNGIQKKIINAVKENIKDPTTNIQKPIINADAQTKHDQKRFGKAYDLIQKEKYTEALALLEKNITYYPTAGNIDYDYAWAMFCYGKQSEFAKAIAYYEIIRERFDGWQKTGANGAKRHWGQKLLILKRLIEKSDDKNKDLFLKEIQEIDKIYGPVETPYKKENASGER